MRFDRKPVLEHLDELLVRFRRSAFYIIGGVGLCYAFAGHLVYWIETPLLVRLHEGARLVFTTPFEKFWVYIRVSFVTGMFLVLPFLGWEIASFIGPGLTGAEKSRSKWLVLSTSVVFVLGIFFGYFFVLPPVLDAVFRFGGSASRELPLLTLSSYVNAVMGILLLSALFLEIPVVMVHLSSWGWVEAKLWAKGRRLSFVINAVVSALLSPPDVLSMLAMMVPLQILYECGILGARMAQWMAHEPAQTTA